MEWLLVGVLFVGVAAFVGSHGTGSTSSKFDKVGSSIGGGDLAEQSAGSRADSPSAALDSSASSASGGAAEATTKSSVSGKSGSKGVGDLQAKIIRTGSVDLVVKKGTFPDAVRSVTSVATGVGGFVSASETTQLGDDPSGTITIRVPAKEFDRVVGEVGKLGKVTAATTGSQDVTGEYTDTASRIRALEDEREQIRLVLSRAENIPDILAVRDRLSAVQGELEQLQGRKQVLDDQTSLSTLTVQISEQGHTRPLVTKPAPERRGFAKFWHDAAGRFTGGVKAISLGFATLAPWLLLGLVLFFPGRVLWRRFAYVPDPAASSERVPVGAERA